ncbi:MAG: WD40 repeat domain-containing protein [Acaryochloridaceae cyanobacterium RL_2_7]|nr:WD40 repeat domain-containing protein [Acaryochloridaceae cyanobacterium RL_2_7]
MKTGQSVQTLQPKQRWIWAAAIHPTLMHLALSDEDTNLYLWDLETQRCICTFVGHQDKCKAIAFHPEGDRLISAGCDGFIKVWDISTGQCLQTFQPDSSLNYRAIAVHPQGDRVAVGSEDGTLLLLSFKAGKLWSCQAHTQAITGLRFDPTEPRLISASEDEIIKIWEVKTGQAQQQMRSLNNMKDLTSVEASDSHLPNSFV